MNRRALLAATAGLAAPLAAWPQRTMYRVGYVGLQELGYGQGKNALIETRFAKGRTERPPEFVAEALHLEVRLLVAGSTSSALAAQRATTTVPSVFAGVVDPIGSGIASSLARPGPNMTGDRRHHWDRLV